MQKRQMETVAKLLKKCRRVEKVTATVGAVHRKGNLPAASLPQGGLIVVKNGGDLLSHFRSTIGAAELNCSVRNGKRWNLRAIAA